MGGGQEEETVTPFFLSPPILDRKVWQMGQSSFSCETAVPPLRMLLAPTLFRDSQSSFGLWAAMANPGQVHSVPLRILDGQGERRPTGSDDAILGVEGERRQAGGQIARPPVEAEGLPNPAPRIDPAAAPDLGPDWVWSAALVLYPSAAQGLGLSREDPEGLLSWLERH